MNRRRRHNAKRRRANIGYVNAYAVSQHYGGPEEGGWWYDAGRAILSQRVSKRKAVRVRKLMRKQHGWVNKHKRTSVLGGEDFEIYNETHPAADWPERRPHYE